MRVLGLLLAALIGVASVVGARADQRPPQPEVSGQHSLVEALTSALHHPEEGVADEAKSCEPAVALLRALVRTVAAAPSTAVATRVGGRVARGPPDGR
ncbi:hypothetical protein [Saccharothrix australiensis]|uniref:Uncharacterized protein n=1 Tax=Saccharothrix australiensis TaxID=2072 RepID=A0A495VYJ5_9PSEU|nr:hypothetical protein [Saccharothrix australiensis]RKT54396.1 hypothetical protein C8E97_3016 [Saccharothrix australiensis]